MRSRKEIEKELKDLSGSAKWKLQRIKVELLLDIRDLVMKNE